jgi:hypothetical protein
MPIDPAPRRLGLVPRIAFGAWLARRGWMAKIAIGITFATALAFAMVAASLAAADRAPVHDVPLVASSAIAWGGGFLLAVTASMRALSRDRDEGIAELVIARTSSRRSYVFARVVGLALILAVVVVGATLLTAAVAIVASRHISVVGRTLHAGFASVVFALAFSVVVAPITIAALGSRSRASGYVTLLAVLFVPELLVHAAHGSWPDEIAELLSAPSALAAFRASLSPGTTEPLRCLRAIVALAVFAAIALAFVDRAARAVEREGSA